MSSSNSVQFQLRLLQHFMYIFSAISPSIEDELKQWKPFNELMLVAEPEEEILFVYEHHAPNNAGSNSTKVYFA